MRSPSSALASISSARSWAASTIADALVMAPTVGRYARSGAAKPQSQRWCTGSWIRYRANESTVNEAPSERRPGRAHWSPSTASNASARTSAASPEFDGDLVADPGGRSARRRRSRPGPSWETADRRCRASSQSPEEQARRRRDVGAVLERRPSIGRRPESAPPASSPPSDPLHASAFARIKSPTSRTRRRERASKPHSGQMRSSTHVQSLSSGTISLGHVVVGHRAILAAAGRTACTRSPQGLRSRHEVRLRGPVGRRRGRRRSRRRGRGGRLGRTVRVGAGVGRRRLGLARPRSGPHLEDPARHAADPAVAAPSLGTRQPGRDRRPDLRRPGDAVGRSRSDSTRASRPSARSATAAPAPS